MARTRVYVGCRVQRVGDTVAPGRARHQLHQPHCADAGNRVGTVTRFDLYQSVHETRIDAVPVRSLLHQTRVGSFRRPRRLPRGGDVAADAADEGVARGGLDPLGPLDGLNQPDRHGPRVPETRPRYPETTA